MNLKQQRFCEYYCGECKGNGTAAAIKAGYNPKWAATNTNKLLKNTNIIKYINEINAEITKSNVATVEEIQSFWTEIFKDPEQAPRDRLRASELLAKCKGMFNNEDW